MELDDYANANTCEVQNTSWSKGSIEFSVKCKLLLT